MLYNLPIITTFPDNSSCRIQCNKMLLNLVPVHSSSSYLGSDELV